MKLKNSFVMRKIAGKDVVLPCGDDVNLNQMITLNESGMYIWSLLQSEVTEDSVAESLSNHYQISIEDAKKHTQAFIEKLKSYNYIEE